MVNSSEFWGGRGRGNPYVNVDVDIFLAAIHQVWPGDRQGTHGECGGREDIHLIDWFGERFRDIGGRGLGEEAPNQPKSFLGLLGHTGDNRRRDRPSPQEQEEGFLRCSVQQRQGSSGGRQLQEMVKGQFLAAAQRTHNELALFLL